MSPTSDQVYVAGHDVAGKERDGVTNARKNIGFCPQVDPLLDLMTGRETLTMFARLRGIPGDTVAKDVKEFLDRLTLTPHADKPAGTSSGGNKRKLSLGIALIADPQVLLIDEASSGLDPVAKRRMWNLFSEVSRERSVILSTHSMQEAEALCSRAGILSSGQLLALGSVQHLKSKYLDGFPIDILCHADDMLLNASCSRTFSATDGSELVVA
jgi:ATP-binding cassette subfamily A (ABC1) protein 3